MKSIIALTISFFCLQAFAQVYPVPPIGTSQGPESNSAPIDKKLHCENLLKGIEKDEHSFMDLNHKKYNSQKNFFKLIDKKLISDSVKEVSKDKIGPKVTNCSGEEVTLLKEISERYKKSHTYECVAFTESGRWGYIEKIDKLIKINEE